MQIWFLRCLMYESFDKHQIQVYAIIWHQYIKFLAQIYFICFIKHFEAKEFHTNYFAVFKCKLLPFVDI